MNVETKPKQIEVNKVTTKNGFTIKEQINGILQIKGNNLRIIINNNMVDIRYLEQRPNHDHNDLHGFSLILPPNGVVDPCPGDGLFKPALLQFSGAQNLEIGYRGYSTDYTVRYYDVEKFIKETGEKEDG